MIAAATAGQKPRTLLVSAGVLVDTTNSNHPPRILLAERNKGHLQGTWEFPGGKVEISESPEEALVRELQEELGVHVDSTSLVPVAFSSHSYPNFHLLMPLFGITQWSGAIGDVGVEGQRLVFVTAEELRANKYQMPPADAPLIPHILRYVSSLERQGGDGGFERQ